MTTYVHTLGDSTLDNIYWVGKENSVESKLQKALGSNFIVKSAAYDGFSTKSLLNGDQIGAVFRGNPISYFAEKGVGVVKPLKKIKAGVLAHPGSRHIVVISVGGNDFRERLMNPIGMLWAIRGVQQRHRQIVEKVKEMGPNIRPVIMTQYKTDAKNDPYKIYTIAKLVAVIFSFVHTCSFGYVGSVVFGSKWAPIKSTMRAFEDRSVHIKVFDSLLDFFYAPIKRYAACNQIPVVDLAKTMDPTKPYYTVGIEPNSAGGAFIAGEIANTINTME